MKKLYTLFALLTIAALAKAVPADPTPFVYTLEDGTEVMAVQHGDEFHSYITDLDGNLLSGSITPTEEQRAMRRMHRMPAATQAGGNFPLKGSPKSVAILVNFKDKKFQHTREDFLNLLNQSGYSVNGATGSCRDYFIACSDSLFSPQFDVWGPYTVSGNMKDYGAPKGQQHDTNPGAAFIEACQLASADGVDFAQYDTDGDGIIDNVFFYYAGNNQAEGADPNTIWPHQSSLVYEGIRINGKTLASYACTSELRGANSTTMCPIGTFCHEFGHVLGLPDFYDTGDGGGYTVGDWDIMAGGNYNNNGRTPPTYSGYERFYLGWRTPVQLTNPGEYSMESLATGGQIYLLANGKHNLSSRTPNPSEFFMIEYRDRTGWDSPSGALTATGVLIWHIDFSSQAWASNNLNNSTPLRYHLEEAGGNRNHSAATDPYPGASNVTAFTPKLHDGTILTTQPIFDIKISNGMASFIYISRGEQHLHAYPDVIDVETTIGTNGKPKQWEPYAIHLTGEQLSPDEVFSLTLPSKNQFKMTFDPSVLQERTSTKWGRSLTLSGAVNAEGKLDTTLYINFNPQKINCDIETAGLTIQSEYNRLNLVINGTAPRHTYVTTPEILSETQLTPYSVTLNWKPVEDAEQYYVTLFQSEPGESDMVQDFEQFDKLSSIQEQGWSSNFAATTTTWKKDGLRALVLKNNGDQITTEQYQAALSEVSFYLYALTSDVDTIGDLIIQASANGETWHQIDTLRVPAKTRNKLYKIALPTDSQYVYVRITYWDNGGNGLAMDQFTATMSEKITYLYRGREKCIFDYEGGQYTMDGLSPNRTYRYQIQCTDGDKGCEEHLTPLSEVHTVTTLDGADPNGKQLTLAVDTINYDQPTHTVYVANAHSGDRLMIYDMAGRLVHIIYLGDFSHAYPLPLERFNAGQTYVIKHYVASDGSLKRKPQWAKFIF